MRLSFETSYCVRLRCRHKRGPRRHAATVWRVRSYWGPRTGRRDMRVAREPEKPCHFRRECRPGFRLTNSRLIHPEKTRLVPFERPSIRPPPAISDLKASASGVIRPTGIHSLLGPLSAGLLGGEAQGTQEPVTSRISDGWAMVPNASTSRASRPAIYTGPEASRALRIVRDHWQRACAVTIPGGCHRTLEELAWPTPPRRRSRLRANVSSAGAVSAPSSNRCPLGVPSGSDGLK